MTPRKLSDSDKNQIVELYRQPGETTLTLANQYGVSNTTISRILKSTLPAGEYEGLIQQKRIASRNPEVPSRELDEVPIQGSILEIPAPDIAEISEPEPALLAASVLLNTIAEVPEPEPTPLGAAASLETIAEASEPEPTVVASVAEDSTSERVVSAPIRRLRKRSSAETETESPIAEISEVVEEISEVVKDLTTAPVIKKVLTLAEPKLTEADAISQEFAEDEDDDLDDLDDDLEEGLDDDFDGDFDDEESGSLLPSLQLNSASFVRVLPLTEAAIPKTCYLVVDRAAELVARPLREFGELGQIPSEEIQEKTLP
ncbi:MAG: transposase, partial [Phormidesmis sp. CAN_BIN36]|nr:transposase [Phormidesmis sp. CAN_BIN36]